MSLYPIFPFSSSLLAISIYNKICRWIFIQCSTHQIWLMKWLLSTPITRRSWFILHLGYLMVACALLIGWYCWSCFYAPIDCMSWWLRDIIQSFYLNYDYTYPWWPITTVWFVLHGKSSRMAWWLNQIA